MRSSGRACIAVAAWLLPALASAQAASGGIWTAPKLLSLHSYGGNVGPKVNTSLQIICEPANRSDPECNDVDAFAYDGYVQFVGERYDENGVGGFRGVASGKPVGGFLAAPYDGVSDGVTAGMMAYTTETQSHAPAHRGTGLSFNITQNATATLRYPAMSISPGGRGGVTIGDWGGGWPAEGGPDLGGGTLDVQNDIASGGHFRSNGSAPTLSACGPSPDIRGTDAAGAVGTGGPVTSCTISFARAYASAPICIVQTFAAATPAAYVGAYTATQLTVRWNSAFHGRFFYICQGVS